MKFKKVLSAVTSTLLLSTSVVSSLATTSYAAENQNNDVNYGEALALSLYFYDANECGCDVDTGSLNWRGNCHTYDATASLDSAVGLGSSEKALIKQATGSSTVDVSGGYHDAGDHVKFNLTMGFNATSLGWAYFDYPEVFKETNTEAHLLDVLRNTCDYFMKTTYLTDSGDVFAFCYNVSDSSDHDYWSSPETQTHNRKTYWATKSNNNSTVAFEMASALASTSAAFQGIDNEYSAECLKYADALYRFGKAYNGNETAGMGDMYGTSSPADEKAWAEAWLYVADSDTYTLPTLKPDGRGRYGSETDCWVYCWDKVWGGYSSLMYRLTGDSAYANELKFEMDNLVSDKNQAYYPISGWGTSRYNCAWQKYAITYAEGKGNTEYLNYAKKQMDYILGNNPTGYSFLIGYGDKYPTRIHHRAANPSGVESTNTLYGALIGGPTTADGDYEDNANRYQYTEPALDYNACFTLAITALYSHFGGDASAVNTIIENAVEFKPGFDFGDIENTATPSRPIVTTVATAKPSETTTTTATTPAITVDMEDDSSTLNLNSSLDCKNDNQIHLTIGDYIPENAQLQKIVVNLSSSKNMGTVVSAAGFSTNDGWHQIDSNKYLGTSGTLEFDTSDVSTSIINGSEMMFGLWWCDSIVLDVESIKFEYKVPADETTTTTTESTTTTTTTKPTTTTTTTKPTTTKPTTTTTTTKPTTTTTTTKPTTTTTTTKPTTTTTTTKPTTTTTTTKPTTTTTTTTTTTQPTTTTTTTTPADNNKEIVLTDVTYGSSYSLKDYDYNSIEKIVLKLDGNVGYGFGGKVVLGNWTVQCDYDASELKDDNTIEFDITNPQDVLTIYSYWGNMSLESVTLIMK